MTHTATRTSISTAQGHFECLIDGDASAPPVFFLHGFPDHPRSFEPVLAHFASAGFRAIAPWQRGYDPSPVSGPYSAKQTANDLDALVDVLAPHKPVVVVGHDWGAAAAFCAAIRNPARYSHLVTLASPHPIQFSNSWFRSAAQRKKSWHFFYFQLFGIAERRAAANDCALIDELWRDWSPDLDISTAPLAEIKSTLSAGNFAPLGYYRAAFWPPFAMPWQLRGKVRTPTLHLHGRNDRCIGHEIGEGQERFYSAKLRFEVLDGVGHFLHFEDPSRVASRILQWLRP